MENRIIPVAYTYAFRRRNRAVEPYCFDIADMSLRAVSEAEAPPAFLVERPVKPNAFGDLEMFPTPGDGGETQSFSYRVIDGELYRRLVGPTCLSPMKVSDLSHPVPPKSMDHVSGTVFWRDHPARRHDPFKLLGKYFEGREVAIPHRTKLDEDGREAALALLYRDTEGVAIIGDAVYRKAPPPCWGLCLGAYGATILAATVPDYDFPDAVDPDGPYNLRGPNERLAMPFALFALGKFEDARPMSNGIAGFAAPVGSGIEHGAFDALLDPYRIGLVREVLGKTILRANFEANIDADRAAIEAIAGIASAAIAGRVPMDEAYGTVSEALRALRERVPGLERVMTTDRRHFDLLHSVCDIVPSTLPEADTLIDDDFSGMCAAM